MKILSGNQLKIIALIAMTCDHIGLQLFPQLEFLRVIGRMAFPLFAYMIAEGCKYTRNRKKYLFNILSLAMLCQVVYFCVEASLYQCVLVTFSLSIIFIFMIEYAKNKKTMCSWLLVALSGLLFWFLCQILPVMVERTTDFDIDYGFWGILLPVIIYYTPDTYKLLATLVGLVPICFEYGGNQWWCLGTVLLLALYNGKKGKANIKNLFYIYYPAHLVGIYLISIFLQI